MRTIISVEAQAYRPIIIYIKKKGWFIERTYSLVEGGIQYTYGRRAAEDLAEWSKREIAHGRKPFMKNYFRQRQNSKIREDIKVERYLGGERHHAITTSISFTNRKPAL